MSYSPPTYFHPLDQHALEQAWRANRDKSKTIWQQLTEGVQLAGTHRYDDGVVHYEDYYGNDIEVMAPIHHEYFRQMVGRDPIPFKPLSAAEKHKRNWCNTEWDSTGTYYIPHPEDDHVLCVTPDHTVHLRYKDTLKLVHPVWCYQKKRYLDEEDLTDWHEVKMNWTGRWSHIKGEYAEYDLKFQVEAIERCQRREDGSLSSGVWHFNFQTTSPSNTSTEALTPENSSSLCESSQPSIRT